MESPETQAQRAAPPRQADANPLPNEASLRAVFERVSDGFVALDVNWRYTYVNQKAAEMLQRSRPEDLIGRHIWSEYPEGVGQAFHQAYLRALETQQPVFLEEHFAPWDRWFENRIYPSPDGLSIYFTEITERKRAELALRKSEERLRLALQAAQQGLYDLNVETGEAVVTPEYATMLGFDPETFCETNSAWIDRLHPDDREPVAATFRAYVQGEIPEYRVEFRQRTRDGGWKWILSLGRIVERAADGRPLRMLGTHTDIDARMRAEARHRAAEERYRITLQSIGDAVIATDASGRVEMLNPVAETLTGFDSETARGRPLDEVFRIVDEATRRRIESPAQRVVREGAVVGLASHTLLVARDGSERPIADSGAPIRDATGALAGVVLVFRDQSEERVVEQALRDSAQRYRELFESNPQPCWVYALDTLAFLAVNDAAIVRYGYSRDEFLAMTIKDIRPSEDVPRLIDNVAHFSGGLDQSGIWRHRKKDGSLIEVEITSHTLQFAGRSAKLVLANDVTARRQAERELARHRADLERLVEERTRELVAARDQAQRANRAKSEFLSRMSHELRTPLNAILGFGQLMAIDNQLDARHRGYAEESARAGQHLLALINDVLDLAQVEAGRVTLTPETLPLDDIVDDCLRMVAPVASQRQVALRAPSLAGVTVRGDRTRLRQVLLNLLSNAIKYNRQGGSVTIEAAPGAAQRLRISVIDDGPGIAAERQAELFQPFSRLGAEFGSIEGTGIGLAIARQLIEMMDGAIGVESRPGDGSRFWVELPVAATASREVATAPSAGDGVQPDSPGQATILYVEDNAANRRLIEQVISRHPNLRLLTAATANEGLEIAHSQRPHLILLDIQLPDIDGYALLARLRGQASTRDIPAVAVTALARPDDRLRARQAGFADYIAKPIDIANFDAMLLRLLAKRD